MKIAFLASRKSIHTVRWVNGISQQGHEVYLITMHDVGDKIDDSVKTYELPFKAPHGYFLNVIKLRNLLSTIRPDLLHVHYASGYGTLGTLSGFHPRLISVWGSDVYEFPFNNPINRQLIKYNLQTADWVCSTSQTMAKYTLEHFPRNAHVSITPFGVDTEMFCPKSKFRDQNFITIGTIKTLHQNYGIDLLIVSFKRIRQELQMHSPDLANKLRLLIV